MRTRWFLSLSLCGALCACATLKKPGDTSNRDAANGSAIIIKGSDLNGGVLQALRSHIPSMRVGTSSASPCPRIVFRAEKSINNQGDPSVYIDGTRMSDTCSLGDVSVQDIDRIEVYQSGMTPYAQIQRNPFGLILIFRRQE